MPIKKKVNGLGYVTVIKYETLSIIIKLLFCKNLLGRDSRRTVTSAF